MTLNPGKLAAPLFYLAYVASTVVFSVFGSLLLAFSIVVVLMALSFHLFTRGHSISSLQYYWNDLRSTFHFLIIVKGALLLCVLTGAPWHILLLGISLIVLEYALSIRTVRKYINPLLPENERLSNPSKALYRWVFHNELPPGLN